MVVLGVTKPQTTVKVHGGTVWLYGDGLPYPSSPIGLLLGNNASSIPINLVIMFVDVDGSAILIIKPSYRLFVFCYPSL